MSFMTLFIVWGFEILDNETEIIETIAEAVKTAERFGKTI